MRADRLLALLMLLQIRGRLTAQALAEELEVSERTIYRDMQALSTAGIPVYTERGPGGGCTLLEDYRTSLTGLNEDEVRALFMLSIPAPLTELGVSQELKAALLKLTAALPSARRDDEARVRQRIHLDWAGFSQPEAPPPHLQTINQAVWGDRSLYLTRRLYFDTRVERLVEPYGLVAKAGVWYLVGVQDGSLRVYDVRGVLAVRLTDERFERPADFDLAAFWEMWWAGFENNRFRYPVTVRVAPSLVPLLPASFGDHLSGHVRECIDQAAPPDAEGWLTVTLPFESLEQARKHLLGLGCAVEVLEPLALRLSIVDFAQQIVDFY